MNIEHSQRQVLKLVKWWLVFCWSFSSCIITKYNYVKFKNLGITYWYSFAIHCLYMTLHEKVDAYMPQPQFVFSYWRYLFVRPKKNLFICNGEVIQQKLRSLKIYNSVISRCLKLNFLLTRENLSHSNICKIGVRKNWEQSTFLIKDNKVIIRGENKHLTTPN